MNSTLVTTYTCLFIRPYMCPYMCVSFYTSLHVSLYVSLYVPLYRLFPMKSTPLTIYPYGRISKLSPNSRYV